MPYNGHYRGDSGELDVLYHTNSSSLVGVCTSSYCRNPTKQSRRTTVTLDILENYHYRLRLKICRAIHRIMCPLLVILRMVLLFHRQPFMVQGLILPNTCTSLQPLQALRTMFLSIIHEAATPCPTTGATLLPLRKPHILMYCIL